MTVTPEACRWCEEPSRGHGQRYTAGIGWHAYTPPPADTINARMRTKYGLDIIESDEYHQAGVYCGEPAHCGEPYKGALPGTPYPPTSEIGPTTADPVWQRCRFCCGVDDGRKIEVRDGVYVRHLTGAGMECSGSNISLAALPAPDRATPPAPDPPLRQQLEGEAP